MFYIYNNKTEDRTSWAGIEAGFSTDEDFQKELDIAKKTAREETLELAALIAETYGPSRPMVEGNPNRIIIGRWEGEQAASMNIASQIRSYKGSRVGSKGNSGQSETGETMFIEIPSDISKETTE